MNVYLNERAKWWPVSPELMASYNDGSHTKKWDHSTLMWYKNGVYHRDGDKPAVIHVDTLSWWKNGKCHRDDEKPAWIDANGPIEWLKNGQWHRTTGPAKISPNNKHEYWINGVNITKEVKSWLATRKYKYPFIPEQQVEFQLTFS
jgi:hypothetical protein